jgi:hypothetical protein
MVAQILEWLYRFWSGHINFGVAAQIEVAVQIFRVATQIIGVATQIFGVAVPRL